jgi:aminoglycoside 2'-N-acetyltransferase I
MHLPSVRVRHHATGQLTIPETAAIRSLLRAAFAGDGDGFTDEDWAHAAGGLHVLLELDGAIVSHAAVVPRILESGGRALRTGYVEGVATDPRHERRGLGSAVMREVGEAIAASYELGALSTASPGFYERLGWRRWTGPTFVRSPDGLVPTPDDDGGILYLPTSRTPLLDDTLPISCDWRPGDVW